MVDTKQLEARLDAALARAKTARADGQRAENEALDLMVRIGTHAALQAGAERDAAVARAEAAEAEVARLRLLFAAEHGWYAATPHLRSIAECVCADIASEDRPCVTCEAHGFVSALEIPH